MGTKNVLLASACRPPKKQQEQKRDAGTENRIPGKKTGQEATKRHPGTKKREPRFAVREHDPKLQISRVKREPFATHSGNQVAPPAEEGVTFKFNKYLGGFETYKYMFNISINMFPFQRHFLCIFATFIF